jgi:hypothetical protein
MQGRRIDPETYQESRIEVLDDDAKYNCNHRMVMLFVVGFNVVAVGLIYYYSFVTFLPALFAFVIAIAGFEAIISIF